jgi:hypothetical protein
MKGRLSLAILLSALPCWSLAAEQMDITHCYSGTSILFHNSKEIMPLVSWAQNGIISSNTENKKLHNAVSHCEGVQRGMEEERVGYGLCKIVDDEGDAITAEIPYTGFDYEVRFLEGTGKWKGIRGSLRSVRTVRSKTGKGAMPATYQGCRLEKGTFELTK